MSAGDFKMNCGDVGPLLVFLACDEVTAEERAAIEAHLAGCADCRELFLKRVDSGIRFGASASSG